MRRRRLLRLVGIAGLSGLAGCSGGGGSNGSNGSSDETAGGSGGSNTGTQPNAGGTTGMGAAGTPMASTGASTTGRMETTTEGGTNGSGGMGGSGGMNGSASMSGSGGMGGGMGGGDRNPKAGEVAYRSVGVDFEFRSPKKAVVRFKLPEPTQCAIAYGKSADYGTLRAERTMTGPKKRHHVEITTSPGTTYNATLTLFDNDLNALRTPNFTFESPDSGSATRSRNLRVNYVETPMAESHFTKRPNLDIGKTNVSVSYRTKNPTVGVVQFAQGRNSTTRRKPIHKPRTNHRVAIHGLQSGTQTQWAVGLIAPDASMYTTVGMAFQTK